MKKYLLIGFLLPMFLCGGVVFANGEEHAVSDPTIHPITQIGLPEVSMGHGQGVVSSDASGHTRDEVSALIRDSQNEENVRSIVRFVLLSLAIMGLIFMFYPRRRVVVLATGESSQAGVPPQNAQQSSSVVSNNPPS